MKHKLILEEVDPQAVKDGKTTISAILNNIDKDKNKWADTILKVVDNIPDTSIDAAVDIVNKTIGDKKASDEMKRDSAEAMGIEEEETTNGWQKVSDILGYIDTVKLAKSNPEAVKTVLITILGIISVIEPTPIGEIITGIVMLLPANVVAKIVELLGYLLPQHWLNKGAEKLADK